MKLYIYVLSLCLFLTSIHSIAFSQISDAVKSDIYSKIKCCSCKVTFEKCTCAEAKEIKAYTEALLESGVGKEEVFYKIAKKFSLKVIADEQTKQDVEKRLIKDAGVRRPEIVLDSTSYDFGQVKKRQGKINKTFKLSNQGREPLIIKNIKTSCPCATVSLKVDKIKSPSFGTEGAPKDWRVEIKPDQAGELEFAIDLTSPHVKIGKLIRDVNINSNDPIYPNVTINVEAVVIE